MAALVWVAIGVYYLIPGSKHVLASSRTATDPHLKHAITVCALAVVALIGARFAANADRPVEGAGRNDRRTRWHDQTLPATIAVALGALAVAGGPAIARQTAKRRSWASR